MTTVQTIVTGAYLRSTAFDPGKLALDAELVAHLNRVYQRLWPLLARARPDQFGAETTLTLGGTPPSASLPASLLDLLALFDAAGVQLSVTMGQDRTRRWNVAPCVYRVGMTLRSRADADDPMAGDVLTLLYLDQPTALTALTDTLDTRWPVRHDQLLVDALAMYLAAKDAGLSESDRNALRAEMQQSVATLVNDFGLAPSAMGWLHADAERVVAG